MPTLQKKAWNTFSLWIRERDKKCVTCGSTNSLQAGHYWHNILDFDEENINAQCKQCNHFLSGNLALYGSYLRKKLGNKAFDNLEARHYLAMKGGKVEPQYYKDLINKYKLL